MTEHKHRFIYSTHKEPLESPTARIKVSELKAIIAKHVEGFNADVRKAMAKPLHRAVRAEHVDDADSRARAACGIERRQGRRQPVAVVVAHDRDADIGRKRR